MQALNSTATSVAHSGLTGLHHHHHHPAAAAAAAQQLTHPQFAGSLQQSAAMSMLTLQQLMAAQQPQQALSNGVTGD